MLVSGAVEASGYDSPSPAHIDDQSHHLNFFSERPLAFDEIGMEIVKPFFPVFLGDSEEVSFRFFEYLIGDNLPLNIFFFSI